MKPPFRRAISRGLRFHCPECGEGRVFSTFFKMNDNCSVCGLSFYPESGYYAGAMYLDYMISAGIFLAIFVPSLFLPTFTRLTYLQKDLLWVLFGAALCLGMARPSYSLWLAIDFWIAPWKAEARPKKEDDRLEVPLVSLTIRSGNEHDSHEDSPRSSENL